MALRWRLELGVFLAAYLVYDAARWLAAGDMGPATRHAHVIVDLERGLGIAVEPAVQHGLRFGPAMWVMSNIYLAAQLLVLPGALLYLYRRAPAVYRRLRDTVVVTWMLSVPVFALFPVAPPRLAGLGMQDTVSHQAGVALTGHSTLFYNPLAAVPSLHCGFAFAIGIALAAAARRRWTKALALAWGPVVSLTVVATGNHYVFDVAAGLLVSLAGYLIARLHHRLLPRPTTHKRSNHAPYNHKQVAAALGARRRRDRGDRSRGGHPGLARPIGNR